MIGKYIICLLLLVAGFPSYSQNWTQLTNYPHTSGWYGSAGFSINGKGYVGATGGSGNTLNNIFYEYNPSNDTWTQKDSFPDTLRRVAASFSIDSFGYVGVGWTGGNSLYSFWCYNPINDSWIQKAPYPGIGGRVTCYASLNGKGYIGGGAIGIGDSQSDWWEYNPGNDTWTQKASFPFGARAGAYAFAIGNLVYVGFGTDQNSNYKDLWAYNPSTDSWTQKTSFPGVGRIHPVGFVINGKAIVGGGYIHGNGTNVFDYYEYDPIQNTWDSVPGFLGERRSLSASFSINNVGYLCMGRGIMSNSVLNDLWKYSDIPIGMINASSSLKEGITVFPNPTSGTFKVVLPESLTSQIQIFNFSGKLHYNESFTDKQEIEISLPVGFPNGSYVIQAVTETGISSKRIMLQRD